MPKEERESVDLHLSVRLSNDAKEVSCGFVVGKLRLEIDPHDLQDMSAALAEAAAIAIAAQELLTTVGPKAASKVINQFGARKKKSSALDGLRFCQSMN